MCERRKQPYKGLKNLIGGKVELGEDGFAAAYRELYEESSVTHAMVDLLHLMDFTYYNPEERVEVYAGKLKYDVEVSGDENDLLWVEASSNFFDMTVYAGEGNIGHMVEIYKQLKGEPIKQVIIHKLDTFKNYTFTVIFAAYGKVGGQWLYCRHKDRDTWETAGGHIEPGETPLDCAKRELREETGAVKFYINPAFDYEVKTANGSSYGQVFYADIEQLGELSSDFEMEEVKGFDTYPERLTYPDILPVLYAKMQSWLAWIKQKPRIGMSTT
jgi:8-oxo-dGTP diphosphatase